MNSELTQEANSNAISIWANVPPLLPYLETIPIEFVLSIHLVGNKVNEFEPASFSKESNSTPLKFEL